MTRKEEQNIQFYRTDAVHSVLKRYKFTEEEKKIIQTAIVTSKKENPNMKLIGEADTLLSIVAATRSLIEIPEDEMEMKKREAAIKMAEHPYEETNFWKQKLDGSTLRLIFGVLFLVMFFVLKNILSADLHEEKEKVLANGAEGHLKNTPLKKPKPYVPRVKRYFL